MWVTTRLKGTNLIFKAVPNPPDKGWPTGKPIWGGSAGASGTGETVGVTFNTLSANLTDYKTITVACGGTATANVVVYELTPKLTPVDNFAGRSQTKLGVGEKAILSYNTEPASLGGIVLQYSKESGDATLFANQFTAGDSDSSVTLRITIASGPSKDQYRELNRTIVTPTASMIQEPESGIRHTQGEAGLGFHAWVYLTPKDVSFKQLQVGEGTGTITVRRDINGVNKEGEGYFEALQGAMHTPGAWHSVFSGNITNGSRVELVDNVDISSLLSPYASAGTIDSLECPIQWYYMNGSSVHPLSIFTQYVTIDSNGTVTMSKGGAGPITRATGADTTTIHPPGYIEQ